MEKAFKFRLYPTTEQESLLRRTMGCVRLVYNKALAARTEGWYERQERIDYVQTSSMLTSWKKEEDLDFLNEVSSVPLQQGLRHLQKAFSNFFAGRAKYPNFKKKHNGGSAEFTKSAFKWKDGQVFLAKCSEPLPIRWSREIPEGSSPSTITVKLTPSGRWYVSLLVDDHTIKPLPETDKKVGLDLGVTSLIATSDGDKIANPKHFKRLRKKLRRRQIRAWLKAGVMDGKEMFPTNEGTPQGGVISPLLANIALHGMEELIMGIAPSIDMKRPDGTQMSVRDKLKSISLIRYADDFVVLHEQIEVIHRCKQTIEEWLRELGLELKPSKTRIAHTLIQNYNEEPGFNFLGFNVRQFPVGKYQSGNTRKGLLGFKTIITSTKESQNTHYRKVAEVINKSRGLDQATLIKTLNPIIRGWCNYYSTVVSQKVFEKIWHLIVFKLLKWGIHRHRNKGRKWIVSKYFHLIDGDSWTFATTPSSLSR